MDERKIDRTDEEGLIDLSRLLREARSVLRRLYWLPLALAAVMALLICLHGWRSYQPDVRERGDVHHPGGERHGLGYRRRRLWLL